MNYNKYLKKFFPKEVGLETYQPYSLQFFTLERDQISPSSDYENLPKELISYTRKFEQDLDERVFNDSSYSFRVNFQEKIANRKGQADKVIEFIRADSKEAKESTHTEHVLIKEKERKKYLPGQIVEKMREQGYSKFNMYHHTQLWKSKSARDPSKGYGCDVVGQWFWYEKWLDVVKEHCKKHSNKYT